MISLAHASSLNSCVYQGPCATMPAGWEQLDFLEDGQSGTTLGHYQNGRRHYLAVRGTWGRNDIMSAMQVFFGADPVDRITFFQEQLLERFGGDPDPDAVAVGGHSLGGLIAAASAERFKLPGLAQNAPGWMTRAPEHDRLQRFLQVRTARDVVADWGSAYPRNLMLPDPSVPDWSVSSLHNLERQNRLIAEHGLGHYRVDDASIVEPLREPCTSPSAVLDRFVRALGKLRAAREYTQLHERLSGQPKP